jgi:hypothetical protein
VRLKLPAISWLAALVRGQAAVAPADVGGRNLPTLALLPDEPLRLARADGAADQQSRVQAFIGLPEARGLECLAVELAGTDASLHEARAVLQAARSRGSRRWSS